jgi:hypothetical protein
MRGSKLCQDKYIRAIPLDKCLPSKPFFIYLFFYSLTLHRLDIESVEAGIAQSI